MIFRRARMEDVKAIYDLLNHYAEKGLLLGRSLSSLYDHLRDFYVCADEKAEMGGQAEGRLAGACSLHICWENLAEIRSLAVRDSYQGRGIGTRLVKSCLADVDAFGIDRVFTLTYKPTFFKRFGFKSIDKKELPHKVWSDCIQCPKFPDCNEEAMIWSKYSAALHRKAIRLPSIPKYS